MPDHVLHKSVCCFKHNHHLHLPVVCRASRSLLPTCTAWPSLGRSQRGRARLFRAGQGRLTSPRDWTDTPPAPHPPQLDWCGAAFLADHDREWPWVCFRHSRNIPKPPITSSELFHFFPWMFERISQALLDLLEQVLTPPPNSCCVSFKEPLEQVPCYPSLSPIFSPPHLLNGRDAVYCATTG